MLNPRFGSNRRLHDGSGRARPPIHGASVEPGIERFERGKELGHDHGGLFDLDRLDDLCAIDGVEAPDHQQPRLIVFGGPTIQEMHHHRPARGRLLGVVASDTRLGESLEELVAGGEIGACHGLV
jgi:hypothetical protein